MIEFAEFAEKWTDDKTLVNRYWCIPCGRDYTEDEIESLRKK